MKAVILIITSHSPQLSFLPFRFLLKIRIRRQWWKNPKILNINWGLKADITKQWRIWNISDKATAQNNININNIMTVVSRLSKQVGQKSKLEKAFDFICIKIYEYLF
jgi:hypothetical protein